MARDPRAIVGKTASGVGIMTLVELREKLRRKLPGYVGTLGDDGRAIYADSEQMILVNPDGPEAADAITTLLERERELRKALEPFIAKDTECALGITATDATQSYCGHGNPNQSECCRVRQARAALTREGNSAA